MVGRCIVRIFQDELSCASASSASTCLGPGWLSASATTMYIVLFCMAVTPCESFSFFNSCKASQQI